MAKSFATSYVVPYKGAVRSAPVGFCGGANAATLDFNWRSYGLDIGTAKRVFVNPGVRVTFNNSPQKVLETVQGVFIDNSDCASPVYLVAPDTGQMITCPDGSSGFYPILTNGTEFVLYIESIAAPYENSQRTVVILVDKPFPPTSDPQFNEFIPASQVSGQMAFASGVQGDQYEADNSGFTITTAGNWETEVSLIRAIANTTLVITNVYLGANNIKSGSERQFAIAITSQGTEVFRQRFFARPYEVPGQSGVFVGAQNHPLNLSGIAVRLRGDTPVNVRYRALVPANTAAPNAIFVPDVHLVFARLINPTV